jgi:peptidoglycan/xylan/chitin deacetylase (PgdA/CDA1 family)
MPRDLVGYGPNPPRARWPGDARVALSIVVNFEEGSEQSVTDGDPGAEAIGEIPYPMPPGIADLTNESIYEYGMRVGLWRVLDVLARHEVKATFFLCGQAMERAPDAARAVHQAGHELISHGYRWEEYFRMDRETERERIQLTIRAFERGVGQRPLGWYCRYGPSVNTRDLLVEEGGFLYDSDAYNDDLPYWVTVRGMQHLVVPYNLDVNDIRFWLGPAFVTGSQFDAYCRETLDWLYDEGASTPRIMSVGLHPRIIGRPGRIGGLDRFLGYARSRPGVWFATRGEIARIWREQFPPDGPLTPAWRAQG